MICLVSFYLFILESNVTKVLPCGCICVCARVVYSVLLNEVITALMRIQEKRNWEAEVKKNMANFM